jgi:hypothetical protein
MTVQARAMEKVGYEPGTAKLFIDPIEAVDDYKVRRGGRTDDTAGQRGGSGQGFIGVLILLVLLAALLWAGGGILQDNVGNIPQVNLGNADVNGD